MVVTEVSLVAPLVDDVVEESLEVLVGAVDAVVDDPGTVVEAPGTVVVVVVVTPGRSVVEVVVTPGRNVVVVTPGRNVVTTPVRTVVDVVELTVVDAAIVVDVDVVDVDVVEVVDGVVVVGVFGSLSQSETHLPVSVVALYAADATPVKLSLLMARSLIEYVVADANPEIVCGEVIDPAPKLVQVVPLLMVHSYSVIAAPPLFPGVNVSCREVVVATCEVIVGAPGAIAEISKDRVTSVAAR